MSTLWVTGLPSNPMRAAKALREAQRFFDAEATYETAQEALDVFGHDGFVFIGDIDPAKHDPQAVVALRESLRSQECETALDLNPERHARQVRARRLTEAGATPEEVFAREAPGQPEPQHVVSEAEFEGEYHFSTEAYETALALMALHDGNPLKACAAARLIGRAADDEDLYQEVIIALVKVFPWLAKMLSEQGFTA